MKHFPIIAILALVSTACGITGQNTQEKRAEQERTALSVQQILDSRCFQIDVDYMMPLRGKTKAVNSYSITVSDNSLDSHLPYFGHARSVPYGGGNGLTFKDKIDSYTDSGYKKDRRTIVINVKNEEDNYIYTMEFFDNGEANVFVQSRNRDSISYRGRLNMDYRKE